MNAISICTKRFHTVLTDDPVSLVQELFSSQDITFAPVIDDKGKCFGVISAKDLLHFHREKRNAVAELAWEICSHNVIEVHPLDKLEKLVESVLKNGVHHLLVVEDEMIVGVISSVDLIRAMQNRHTAIAAAG